MGILKTIQQKGALKVISSSITETITATIIIFIVFVIATLSLNTILKNNVENDTTNIENIINEYVYKSSYNKNQIPSLFEQGEWVISVSKKQQNAISFIVLEAVHKRSKKKFVKTIIAHEN